MKTLVAMQTLHPYRLMARALLAMLTVSIAFNATARENPPAEGDNHAARAQVAVAANFTATARQLASDFESATDYAVDLSFGSTGKLYTQIYHGAPYEVFLAADSIRPARAEREGLAVAGSRFTYARGRLVLWSNTPSDLPPRQRLLQSHYRWLALANPETAPYGAAGMEVLARLQITDADKKLAYGESVAQAYQFVATGNAELGFIALSQVITSPPESFWLIPDEFYQPLDQQAVLLRRGEKSAAAIAFIDYLKSDRAQQIIRRHGYGI